MARSSGASALQRLVKSSSPLRPSSSSLPPRPSSFSPLRPCSVSAPHHLVQHPHRPTPHAFQLRPLHHAVSSPLPFSYRAMSGDASPAKTKKEDKVLQDVPSANFWTEIFDTLDLDALEEERGGEGREIAKVTKWLKKPREAVKKGEEIVEIEAAGAVLGLKANYDGFMGPHLVKEDATCKRGTTLCQIFAEPSPMPAVSASAFQEALSASDGSVSQLSEGMEVISSQRNQVKEELALAHRVAHRLGLSAGADGVLVARVPGYNEHFYTAPLGVPWDKVRDRKSVV